MRFLDQVDSLEMSRADEMGRRGDIFRTGREPANI